MIRARAARCREGGLSSTDERVRGHVTEVTQACWKSSEWSPFGTNTFFVSLIGKFRCPNFATSRANFAKISLVFFYFSLVRTGKSAKNFFAVGVDLALYIYSKLRSGRTGLLVAQAHVRRHADAGAGRYDPSRTHAQIQSAQGGLSAGGLSTVATGRSAVH
jgi:hypothetical protein